MIMLGGNELMSSRLRGSEEELARLACHKLAGRKRPHILIGGLGMGFTLRAALADLPADAAVTVAELVPAIVEWAQGPLAHLYRDCLSDPRVTVRIADVDSLIRAGAAGYDAILLDVDNGPDGLTHAGNDRLYDTNGLSAAAAALKPGGILAIWSAAASDPFTRRLRDAGFTVDEVRVRATAGRKGAHHLIWFATRPA